MKTRWRKVALFLSLSALSSLAVADTVLKAHVDVSGQTGNRSAPTPLPGDYTFTFGKNQATVVSPNGKLYVFDFDRKTFTSINPTAKTFYQSDIAEVISVGDRVQPGHRVDGQVTFSANPATEIAPDLAQPSKPYHVLLVSTLLDVGGAPGGFGAGYSPVGGLIFNGASNTQRTSVEGKRRLEGQFWLGDAPADLNKEQMNATIECVLLWGSPQLKEFAKKVHDSSKAIFGSDFSLTVETQHDYASQVPPRVSFKVTSLTAGTLDPATLTTPQDYKNTRPPMGPLGA